MMRIVKLAILSIGFAFVIGLSAYVTVMFLIESEETVVVPDLIGKDVVYCLELLTDMGLDIKVKDSQYSNAVANHHVINQYPEPGAEIKKGRDIRLFLSKGKKYLQLPDLKKIPLDRARLVLEANGLHAGIVSHTFHDNYLRHRVISQEPRAGQLIARGSVVNLLVSGGRRPETYIMPDLTGMPFSSAVLLLEEVGLLSGEITSAADDRFPRNTVIGHDPKSGFKVVRGDRVDLMINGYSEKNRLSRLAGGGATLFRYRLEKGFLNRHIRLILNCYGLSISIVDEFKKPGETVWVLVPSRRDATVFVYVDHELVVTEVFSSG